MGRRKGARSVMQTLGRFFRFLLLSTAPAWRSSKSVNIGLFGVLPNWSHAGNHPVGITQRLIAVALGLSAMAVPPGSDLACGPRRTTACPCRHVHMPLAVGRQL